MIVLTLLGILAPAALMVAAVRRWIGPVPWRIAMLFLLLTLVFLRGAVWTSKVPVPLDEVARGYPWRGVFGEIEARNPITNDTVKLFLPWMQVAREELTHGRAPLWNRYSFSGYPLLANGESAPFSPLFMATLFVPLPKQLVAMAALKIFSALLFTWLFLKREKASDASAVFGAVVFGFSTVMTVFLYYSTASVIAFLPAAILALCDAMEKQTKASVVFVAVVIVTVLANGHPESVLHVAIGCAAVLGVDLIGAIDRRDWLVRLRAPLAGVAAGLALAAPAWAPVLEQVLISERLATLHSLPHPVPMSLMAAWGIISPNGFGHPLRHNWSWMYHYVGVAPSYAGLFPLMLFAAAATSRRTLTRERMFIVLAIVIFLIAMDWSVLGHLLNAAPPFNIVANDKLRFVCIFLLAVVAAKTLETGRSSIPRSPGLYIAAMVVTALALYVYGQRAHLMRPIDLAGIAAIGIFLVLPSRARPWGAAGLACLELLLFNSSFNALVDARYFRPDLPIVDALRARAPQEPFRVAGLNWMFSPNSSAQYGLEDVRGSDPMAFAGYDRFLQRFTIAEPGSWIRRILDPNRPELAFLNVRFLLAEPDAVPGGAWRLVYRGADGTLWENPRASPRFFSRHANVQTVQETAPGEFTMRVVSSMHALVESSEPLGPGRRVYVRGHRVPLRHIEGAFIGFEVPAGASDVRVVYRPMSFYASCVVAMLALIGLSIFRAASLPSAANPADTPA